MVTVAYKAEDGPTYQCRLESEFANSIDRRLVAIILELADFMLAAYQKTLTITCLVRTTEENAAVGGGQYSAHLHGRAVDIRLHDLEDYQGRVMLGHVKALWAEDFLYALAHGEGSNHHLHLNITRKYAREITRD